MQEGVRDWVRQTTRHPGNGQNAASPATLLSLLCASAFRPLLMANGAAAADIAVLSPAGGGALTEAVTDALAQLRQPGRAHPPSRDEVEKGIARHIQQPLAAGGQRADALRSEIASVLTEIDAGGTALRAAMEETNEGARADVIAAISVISAGFSEMEFLVKDAAKAAETMQERLDAEGANARAVIERNERQATDIRLVREDLAVKAAGAAGPPAAGPDDRAARWVRGCPYRGLLPFNEDDAGVFYGRERLAAELAGQLAARLTRGGLVVVTGASGAGKSSLLRAGLLPILARGQQIPGSGQWLRLVMTPASDPLTELAARLAALGGQDAAAVRDGLAQHPDQAHLAVRQTVLAAARHDDGHPAPGDRAARLVLIVDQFEQIFTLGTDPDGEAERRAFVTALCAAATSPAGPGQEPPALVLLAVRGDFWDRCAAYPGLAGALQEGQFVVGPMTEPELRAAITGPAHAAGLDIDPGLTDAILNDLRAAGGDGAAAALPLLSEAMALTWDKREGDRLTSHGYDQAGGVRHAVATGADEVYDALPAGRQALARDLLRRMTVASSDGRLARRPVTRDELYTGLKPTNQAQADTVLEALVAGRLVVVEDGRAQIAQDILLRAWPRLRGWLEDDQALTAVDQAASRSAEAPARSPALTATQLGFPQASGRAFDRSGRRLRRAVALLAVVALVATTALVVVFVQRNTALQQRDQAIYNQAVAEAFKFGTSNTPLAAQLNLAAYRLRPTQDQASRLLDAENTPLSSALSVGTGGVGSVAFSPGGHTLASGTNDGTVRLWDVADPVHPVPLAKPLTVGSAVFSVAFSPDGQTLISGNYDGTIRLWNVADPRHPLVIPQTLGAGTGAVYSVAFSPDGHVLASGDIDGTVRLWDFSNPAHPVPLALPLIGSSPVLSVAFSPDGNVLASGGDGGTIQLWDVANPAHPRALGRPLAGTGDVFSVAFSPDGHTLAAGGDGNTIRLWDVADPAHPRPLGRPLSVGSIVESVAFGPGGHTLASGDGDGTVRLWDVADPARSRPLGQPLVAGTNAVLWVAFSPDGHKLAAGSYDGAVQLWSLPQTVLSGGGGGVNSVAFTPGGHTLASGSDGAVQLWDVADTAHPVPLGQPLAAGAVNSVAFSPNGRTLATGAKSGTVQLWDVADPAHPVPLGQPLTVGAVAVESVAFSPDGRMLAAGSFDGNVQLWDVADPAHPVSFGLPLGTGASVVYTVAFSPNGRTLASGGDDGVVRLWDVADPAHPRMLGRPLPGGVGAVASVAFSRNGRTLASGSYDGTIRLWDVADPAHARRFGRPVKTGANIVYSVAFSPNGRMLASGGDNGMIRLWDVAEPAHPRPAGRALTGGTGVVYSVAFGRDGRTLASGTYDGAVQLWNLNVGYAIQRICATAGDLTPKQWHAYIPQLPYQPSCAQ
jgi:WD40 repeat protein